MKPKKDSDSTKNLGKQRDKVRAKEASASTYDKHTPFLSFHHVPQIPKEGEHKTGKNWKKDNSHKKSIVNKLSNQIYDFSNSKIRENQERYSQNQSNTPKILFLTNNKRELTLQSKILTEITRKPTSTWKEMKKTKEKWQKKKKAKKEEGLQHSGFECGHPPFY